MDKWDYFQNRAQDLFFLFYILILIYFFEYETIVRSSAWSFGHSDPNPNIAIGFTDQPKSRGVGALPPFLPAPTTPLPPVSASPA
jgi:hypothetical protein